ncbi:MAG: hypothetical protein AAF602_26445 [Myxococcota bacterium]
MSIPVEYSDLPGADLVHRGLEDLREGRTSAEALLVCIGAPRLRDLGLAVPDSPVENPEHALWFLLAERQPDFHSAFNALRRRLVSFQRALEHRRRRAERPAVASLDS